MLKEYSTHNLNFAPLYSRRLWSHIQTLLVGTVLAPGKWTVTAVLRVMGLSSEKHFQNYHRELNRATWSSLEVSRVLRGLLVSTFAATGALVFSLDDTIERRVGKQIKAKGIYRDPVRSSHSHFVKASGLRWLSLMLLVPIPFARRVWALPFLTALAPSERYYQSSQHTHKKSWNGLQGRLTDWARQMLLQLWRWLLSCRIVVVTDSGFAVISLLWRMTQLAQPICMITRFRLDAPLFSPAPPRQPKQIGARRKKGQRLATLAQVLADAKTT